MFYGSVDKSEIIHMEIKKQLNIDVIVESRNIYQFLFCIKIHLKAYYILKNSLANG